MGARSSPFSLAGLVSWCLALLLVRGSFTPAVAASSRDFSWLSDTPQQQQQQQQQQRNVTARLLDTLAAANQDYFGTAKVYRYPDAEGQTKEDLVRCYLSKVAQYRCSDDQPCDPDDDASPAHEGRSYIPQDLGELFLLTNGNVDDPSDPDIDLFVLNPFLVLSAAVGMCNGMNHTARLSYWYDLLINTPATQNGEKVDRRHVFVSQSWTTFKLLRNEPGNLLRPMLARMTYLINEKNTHWAGVRWKHPGIIFVVPYLAHRYITFVDHRGDTDADNPDSQGTIAFIGSLRGNTYRLVAAGPLADASFASIGVDASFVKSSGPSHRRAAEHYSQAMMRTTFCLHLPGDTITSRRIFDAINAGCVPVIVTGAGSKPGWANVTLNKVYPKALDPTPAGRKFRREMTFVNLPFSEVIPYESFSIVVDGEDWAKDTLNIATKIVNTPRPELHRLQLNLAKWAHFFDYRHPSGDMNKLIVSMILNQTRGLGT